MLTGRDILGYTYAIHISGGTAYLEYENSKPQFNEMNSKNNIYEPSQHITKKNIIQNKERNSMTIKYSYEYKIRYDDLSFVLV